MFDELFSQEEAVKLYAEEVAKKVAEETRKNDQRQFAISLLEDETPLEKIVKYTDLTIDEVKKLRKKMV